MYNTNLGTNSAALDKIKHQKKILDPLKHEELYTMSCSF